jgi:hypothetical protein
MVEDVSRFSLSPTARRIVRSYGVLILIAIAFLILAMFVREEDKTVPVESMSGPTGVSIQL